MSRHDIIVDAIADELAHQMLNPNEHLIYSTGSGELSEALRDRYRDKARRVINAIEFVTGNKIAPEPLPPHAMRALPPGVRCKCPREVTNEGNQFYCCKPSTDPAALAFGSALPSVPISQPPPGYEKLPDDHVACNCIRLWTDGEGNYYCCRKGAS